MKNFIGKRNRRAMSNIALIVAMSVEVPDIFQSRSGLYFVGDNTIRVEVSGIGQKRARLSTQKVCRKFLKFCPDYLITLGFCGGTGHRLTIGQLILANTIAYHDQEINLQNSYLDEAINLLSGFEYQMGKLQTFNRPVFSKSKISADTIAVDMEAFAIADTARQYQIPVVVIKAVSDIVAEKASVLSFLNFVQTIRNNAKQAKNRLNEFAKAYFGD